MNHWHNEFMAEYHRKEILEEAAQIQLEKEAMQYRVYRPSIFDRTMFTIANWMISTGKQMRKRYKVPAVNCGKSPTSYAHR